jgi:hypothetical protein
VDNDGLVSDKIYAMNITSTGQVIMGGGKRRGPRAARAPPVVVGRLHVGRLAHSSVIHVSRYGIPWIYSFGGRTDDNQRHRADIHKLYNHADNSWSLFPLTVERCSINMTSYRIIKCEPINVLSCPRQNVNAVMISPSRLLIGGH